MHNQGGGGEQKVQGGHPWLTDPNLFNQLVWEEISPCFDNKVKQSWDRLRTITKHMSENEIFFLYENIYLCT